jgi:hypothetical protein
LDRGKTIVRKQPHVASGNRAIGSGHASPVCGQIEGHAGVTTATGVRIERGEIELRMTTLRKVAHALEVDPAELVE